MEYSALNWGSETLTFLTPNLYREGYLAVPELVNKVLKSRFHIFSEVQAKLGIQILPASARQILNLRTRGSIETMTGKC